MELNQTKTLNIPKCISEIFVKHRDCSYLGRVFSTKKNFYFYDTGTGKIFVVYKIQFEIIESILTNNSVTKLLEKYTKDALDESLQEIALIIESENILSAPKVSSLGKPDIEAVLKSMMSLLTIEVTEKCNLRCKYCVYSSDSIAYREFGSQSISFEYAKKAIDFFFSIPSKEKGIGFYGGEPLIEFDIVKECVIYIKKTFPEINATYTITTNGVLMTDDIAKFLLENKFVTIFSIDGPEYIHNKNRVDLVGNGSFEKALLGLKKMVKSARNLNISVEGLIGINAVLDQVGTKEFDDIQDFFKNSIDIPKHINITTSYVDKGGKPTVYQGVDSPREKELVKRILEVDPLTSWSLMHADVNTSMKNLFSKNNIEKDLLAIHKRILVDKPVQHYRMNGCCIPAARRLYVTASGEYRICERMGPSPSIGNVDSGLDLASIKKHYLDDFCDSAVKYCKECWAINLCGLCYVNCFEKDGVDFSNRHALCQTNRAILQNSLVAYHEILETNPSALEYLNDIITS